MTLPDNDLYKDAFARDGYFVCPDVLSDEEVAELRAALEALPPSAEVRRKRGVYGARNLFDICRATRALAAEPAVRWFATRILGDGAFAVRATYFDKVPDANWSLFWHQDNVIAVKERIEAPGFTGWSRKAGVWQTQPPAAILGAMVAVRVHLDDSRLDNGPLRVLPGSHRFGWLDDELAAWKARVAPVTCVARRGGIVALCPLTLHASAASESLDHRRVIHLEYAAADLPGGLEWKWRI